MSEFIAEIKAKLNQSSLQDVEKQINSKPITLNNIVIGKIDTSKLRKDVEAALSNITVGNITLGGATRNLISESKAAGEQAGQQMAKSISGSLTNIKIDGRALQNGLDKALSETNLSSKAIDEVTKKLEEMKVAITSIQAVESKGNVRVNITGVDELGRTVTLVEQYQKATKKTAESVKTVSTSIKQSWGSAANATQKANADLKVETARRIAEVKRLEAEKLAETKKIKAEELATSKRVEAEKLAETKKIKAEELATSKRVEAEKLVETKRAAAEQLTATKNVAAQQLAETKRVEAEKLAATKRSEAEILAETKRIEAEKLVQTRTNASKEIIAAREAAAEKLAIKRSEIAQQSSYAKAYQSYDEGKITASLHKSQYELAEFKKSLGDISGQSFEQLRVQIGNMDTYLEEANTWIDTLSDKTLSKANFVQAFDEAQSSLRKYINAMTEAKSLQTGGKGFATDLQSASKAFDTGSITKQVESAQAAYSSLLKTVESLKSAQTNGRTINMSGLDDTMKTAASGVESVKNKLNELRELYTAIQNGDTSKIPAFVSGFNTLNAEITKLNSGLGTAKAQADVAKNSLAALTAINQGQIGKDIANITTNFEKLKATVSGMSGGSGSGLQTQLTSINGDLERLKQLQTDFTSSGSMSAETLNAKYAEYSTILQRVKNNMAEVTAQTKQYASSLDVAKLQSKMQTWLQQNPRAAKQYGQSIKALSSELTQLSATEGVTTQKSRQVAQSFEEIKMSAQSAGLTGRSFGSSLQAAFQSLSRYVGISTLIYRGIATLRQGIRGVVDLDTALVDLQKTAKATREELSSFYYDANEQAKKFGVTTKEIISAASEWSRLGYSLNDSKTMAQVSSIFKSISPGMDMESATSGLVSTMKAYNIAANDALDGIASKINAIGNSQALSNENIVEFLTRSSSAMAAANNTLEETIAIGTAAKLLAVCTEMCIRNIFNCR